MMLPNVQYHRVAFEMGVERKKAFAEKCVLEGRSMTDIVQELVDDYLKRKPRKRACEGTKLYVSRANHGITR